MTSAPYQPHKLRRIAKRLVRLDTALAYVFTDHLGSATVTIDDHGATPTERRYTGQLQQSDVGLYYYNPRWYSPGLSRWIQPDTIVPNAAYSQGLNRYAFVRSYPIRYSDPSGHRECDAQDSCGAIRYQRTRPDWRAAAAVFGVAFRGDGWSDAHMAAAVVAAQADRSQMAATTHSATDTASQAFRAAYGLNTGRTLTLEWNPACDLCRSDALRAACGPTNFEAGCEAAGAHTHSRHRIQFATMSDNRPDSFLRQRNHVVHELGHAFAAANGSAYAAMHSAINADPVLRRGDNPSQNYGFAEPLNVVTWVQNASASHTEIFADQFLGSTFGRWETNSDGTLTDAAQRRATWMRHTCPAG